MVLITTPSSNEDSQGAQLRISKKVTTVCSGKRSRFSKPRPNLSVSKRGELNVPASTCKTNKNTEGEVGQALSSNIDTNNISQECNNQNTSANSEEKICIIPEKQSNTVTDKKIEAIQSDFHEKTNKKVVEEDIEIISDEKNNKKIEAIQSDFHEKTNKKTVKEDDVKIISHEDDELLELEDCSPSFSDPNAEKLSHHENIQNISNTDVEKSVPKENDSVLSNAIDNNTSKENDIQARPAKNSGSPIKVPESERRGTSIVTPTVIDKSKYPHLTSILTKKRTEPRKEIQQKRRKKFKKGDAPPERSKMTMADLIYWNPSKTEQSQKSAATVNEKQSGNVYYDNVAVEEECVDDVNENENENNVQDSVPKLVISEDGQINIDQSSLFVSRNVAQPISTEVVRKDDTTYSSFRKRPLTKHWTAKDTANFYRALSLVGADFSLMEQIFPNRTRRELKQKFKREEKFNIDLINKVLYESQTFDELTLNDFIDQNSTSDDSILINGKEDIQTAGKEKSRKQRTSKKTKSVDNETCDSSINHLEEETENEKPENNKEKKKKKRKLSDDEDVEIVVTDFTNYNNTDEHKGSKRKRNAKKLPDDFIDLDAVEELQVLSDYETNNSDTDEHKGNKRKTNAKKLPGDFIDLDAVAELQVLNDCETNNSGSFEKTNSSENQENSNVVEMDDDVEEIPSENTSVILSKIINREENTGIPQNLKEESSNVTMSLPVVINDDEKYISVEYIKNDSNTDLTMLSNVMAYEVVNTQTPVPKKKRKINSVSPGKTRELFLATKISPTNYTNYTPV